MLEVPQVVIKAPDMGLVRLAAVVVIKPLSVDLPGTHRDVKVVMCFGELVSAVEAPLYLPRLLVFPFVGLVIPVQPSFLTVVLVAVSPFDCVRLALLLPVTVSLGLC